MKPLRQTLLNGTHPPGASLFLANPDVDEVVAQAGFPLFAVDRKHAAAGMSSALHWLRTIRATSDAFVMARTRDGSAGAIKP